MAPERYKRANHREHRVRGRGPVRSLRGPTRNLHSPNSISNNSYRWCHWQWYPRSHTSTSCQYEERSQHLRPITGSRGSFGKQIFSLKFPLFPQNLSNNILDNLKHIPDGPTGNSDVCSIYLDPLHNRIVAVGTGSM